MDGTTLNRFNLARELAGIPFYPTSAARTREHELAMGRPGTSSHVFDETKKAKAMDIACNNSRDRYKMVTALLKVGFTRIGIAESFIHADDDENKAQEVIWTY